MKSSRQNVVYPAGLDGYHFDAMKHDFTDDEIINGLKDNIKSKNPDMRTSEAFSRATHVFEYLEAQVQGGGCCAEVRQALQEAVAKRDEPPARRAA